MPEPVKPALIRVNEALASGLGIDSDLACAATPA
jgi:hypothetical protein